MDALHFDILKYVKFSDLLTRCAVVSGDSARNYPSRVRSACPGSEGNAKHLRIGIYMPSWQRQFFDCGLAYLTWFMSKPCKHDPHFTKDRERKKPSFVRSLLPSLVLLHTTHFFYSHLYFSICHRHPNKWPTMPLRSRSCSGLAEAPVVLPLCVLIHYFCPPHPIDAMSAVPTGTKG